MPLMTVNAKFELEYETEERPFEHVSKGELVRGVEVWEKLVTEIPERVTLDGNPVAGHPTACCIEAGMLWHGEERRFYRIRPCSVVVSSPGQIVKSGEWLAAVCWRSAPGGSQYAPKFRKGVQVEAVMPAEAFVSLANEWPWPKVAEGFGPKRKSELDDEHVRALYLGAAEALEAEYEALDDRRKMEYLTRVSRDGLLGECFAPEHFPSPRAESIFRDGLRSWSIGAAQDFTSMGDEWRKLRPETVLDENSTAPVEGRKGKGK